MPGQRPARVWLTSLLASLKKLGKEPQVPPVLQIDLELIPRELHLMALAYDDDEAGSITRDVHLSTHHEDLVGQCTTPASAPKDLQCCGLISK